MTDGGYRNNTGRLSYASNVRRHRRRTFFNWILFSKLTVERFARNIDTIIDRVLGGRLFEFLLSRRESYMNNRAPVVVGYERGYKKKEPSGNTCAFERTVRGFSTKTRLLGRRTGEFRTFVEKSPIYTVYVDNYDSVSRARGWGSAVRCAVRYAFLFVNIVVFAC